MGLFCVCGTTQGLNDIWFSFLGILTGTTGGTHSQDLPPTSTKRPIRGFTGPWWWSSAGRWAKIVQWGIKPWYRKPHRSDLPLHGSTTCLLYVGLLFGTLALNKSWSVNLTLQKTFITFYSVYIYIYIEILLYLSRIIPRFCSPIFTSQIVLCFRQVPRYSLCL